VNVIGALRRLWDVILGVKDSVGRNNFSIVAAGVAFFGFLALIPALASVVFFYGLVADPTEARAQIEALRDVLPEQATAFLASELDRLLAGRPKSLGIGAVTGILVTLWSVTKGSRALINALNIVYGAQHGRGFLHGQAAAIVMTLATVLVAILALALLVVLPLVFQWLGLGSWQRLIELLRWPVLLGVSIFGLGALYRYAPDQTGRGRPRTRWLSAGAALATILWLTASFLFAYYVGRAAGFSAAFGSAGTVVVLLFWIYISAFVLLLGGALNVELERRQDEARADADAEAA
jgi:membrane protein